MISNLRVLLKELTVQTLSCSTRELLQRWTESSRIPASRKRSVWRNKKPQKRTVSCKEDRSLTWWPGRWRSPRQVRNRRRRTREGPERACANTFAIGEGWINILPWYRLIGVAKTSSETQRRKSRAAQERSVVATWYGDDSPGSAPRKLTGKAGENGQHSGEMGGSSPWTRPSAPGCGDTLKAAASDPHLIWGGDRPRRRLQGRHRLGHRPVVLLRTETARCTVRPMSGWERAAAPSSSVAVRDRGHWKGDAGSGWATLEERRWLLTSDGKVIAPGCASKAGRVSRWEARRSQALRILPGHWGQWSCRELCRSISSRSSKWQYSGVRFKMGRNSMISDEYPIWWHLGNFVQTKNTRVWETQDRFGIVQYGDSSEESWTWLSQIEDNGENEVSSRIWEWRILRSEMEILKQAPWSKIRGKTAWAKKSRRLLAMES